MNARVPVIALLAISVTMLILTTNGTLVSADPCTATLSYPVIPVQYGNSNVPIVVPISASCSTYYGNQLYATGSAYDTTSNLNLGSTSTVLSSVNGGTQFNGQLGFNVSPTSPGDSVQISVSLYNGQYGNLLTATSETVQVGGELQQVQQVTTTTVTENENPYYSLYPTAYPMPQQPNQSQYYQPQYQTHHQSHYFSQALAQNSNNVNLFDYVVIIAILAAVVIATAGLVLVARRQPAWPQPQQPMPR